MNAFILRTTAWSLRPDAFLTGASSDDPDVFVLGGGLSNISAVSLRRSAGLIFSLRPTGRKI